MTLGFKGIHGSGQRMLLNQNDVRVIWTTYAAEPE